MNPDDVAATRVKKAWVDVLILMRLICYVLWDKRREKNHADLAKTVLICMCICVARDSSGRKAEEEARISKARWIYRL